jgi:hypothetical protein
MNGLEAALVDIAGFLEESAVPYMVIGGFANLRWGRPRLTQDLDVTIQLDEARWAVFIERMRRRFQPLAESPLEFARETRVVPVVTPAGVRVDLILAGLPYEEQAIARAREVPVAGRTVRFCAPEDLVLHKLASERPRDREDVEGVIARQGDALDRVYLDARVEALAAGLERPEIADFYRSCFRDAGRPRPWPGR